MATILLTAVQGRFPLCSVLLYSTYEKVEYLSSPFEYPVTGQGAGGGIFFVVPSCCYTPKQGEKLQNAKTQVQFIIDKSTKKMYDVQVSGGCLCRRSLRI